MIVMQMWVVINNLTTGRQMNKRKTDRQIITFTVLLFCLANRAEYQFGNLIHNSLGHFDTDRLLVAVCNNNNKQIIQMFLLTVLFVFYHRVVNKSTYNPIKALVAMKTNLQKTYFQFNT